MLLLPAEWTIEDVFLDLDYSRDLDTPSTRQSWGRCDGNSPKELNGELQLGLDLCKAA